MKRSIDWEKVLENIWWVAQEWRARKVLGNMLLFFWLPGLILLGFNEYWLLGIILIFGGTALSCIVYLALPRRSLDDMLD